MLLERIAHVEAMLELGVWGDELRRPLTSRDRRVLSELLELDRTELLELDRAELNA